MAEVHLKILIKEFGVSNIHNLYTGMHKIILLHFLSVKQFLDVYFLILLLVFKLLFIILLSVCKFYRCKSLYTSEMKLVETIRLL